MRPGVFFGKSESLRVPEAHCLYRLLFELGPNCHISTRTFTDSADFLIGQSTKRKHLVIEVVLAYYFLVDDSGSGSCAGELQMCSRSFTHSSSVESGLQHIPM